MEGAWLGCQVMLQHAQHCLCVTESYINTFKNCVPLNNLLLTAVFWWCNKLIDQQTICHINFIIYTQSQNCFKECLNPRTLQGEWHPEHAKQQHAHGWTCTWPVLQQYIKIIFDAHRFCVTTVFVLGAYLWWVRICVSFFIVQTTSWRWCWTAHYNGLVSWSPILNYSQEAG